RAAVPSATEPAAPIIPKISRRRSSMSSITRAGQDPAAEPLPADPPASMPAALYVVATRIGNLEDLGRRAARVLRSVTLIAAEDTRTSRPLLQHIGAGARCIALHAHNEAAAAQDILERIAGGESVALITDAGTPGISDPGARLVAAAHRPGAKVVPVPGPSALTALVSAAGLAEEIGRASCRERGGDQEGAIG